MLIAGLLRPLFAGGIRYIQGVAAYFPLFQIAAAATELLSSQSAAFKALEAHMQPFGFKKFKAGLSTVAPAPLQAPKQVECAPQIILEDAFDDEQDENSVEPVITAPLLPAASHAPSASAAVAPVAASLTAQPATSPLRTTSILDIEDNPTPT